MYLTILLLLFLFLITKNIEGYEGYEYSDRIKLHLEKKYLPPVTIGFGKCSVDTVEDFPPCMNGFICENKLDPHHDNRGVCNEYVNIN